MEFLKTFIGGVNRISAFTGLTVLTKDIIIIILLVLLFFIRKQLPITTQKYIWSRDTLGALSVK